MSNPLPKDRRRVTKLSKAARVWADFGHEVNPGTLIPRHVFEVHDSTVHRWERKGLVEDKGRWLMITSKGYNSF